MMMNIFDFSLGLLTPQFNSRSLRKDQKNNFRIYLSQDHDHGHGHHKKSKIEKIETSVYFRKTNSQKF